MSDLVKLLEDRIGQDFDGECHLTEHEAHQIIAALRAGGKPVAFMHADHVEQYKNKTADGIFWANNERTDFYTVPLFAHPAPSDLERQLAEAQAELKRTREIAGDSRIDLADRLFAAEDERAALAADNARLVEAIGRLLSCPSIADENHSDPEWGCKETAEAVSFARAALSGASIPAGAKERVPEFSDIAKRKLESLLADGWQVNGYALFKDIDRRGFIDLGGFVGWWLPEYYPNHTSDLTLTAPAAAGSQPVKLTYTNWRGETSERTITPLRVYFGATDWHPEPQWLLRAFDHDKQAERDFALKDFGNTASADKAPARETVPAGQTPLDKNLEHRLLEVISEGAKARDTGAGSPYHGHSLEHCLHAIGWVQRDLRLALDVARDNARREALEEAARLADQTVASEIAKRDFAMAEKSFEGALTRARQAQTAEEIAAALRALANPAREGE